MEEINGNSMSRPLLRSNMEWAMIHIGIGNCSLFDIDYDLFGHLLPRTWISSLWQFAHEYQLQLPSYEHIIKVRRDNDKFLMEEFQRAGFSKKQLIKLNRCRFYLQVETLSDITDGKGDQISTLAYTGHRGEYANSYHDWPQQVQPDNAHWTLWRKALRDSFKRTTVQRLGILTAPLGPWIDGNRDQWKWFFSEDTTQLYYRTDSTPSWKVYKCDSTNGNVRKRTQFRFEASSDNLPINAYRATVTADQNNNNRFRLTGWATENVIIHQSSQQKENAKM